MFVCMQVAQLTTLRVCVLCPYFLCAREEEKVLRYDGVCFEEMTRSALLVLFWSGKENTVQTIKRVMLGMQNNVRRIYFCVFCCGICNAGECAVLLLNTFTFVIYLCTYKYVCV